MAPPSTSIFTTESAPTADVGDSASPNDGASAAPPPSTAAAKQDMPCPQPPASTRSDGDADGVRLQSQTTDARARRMLSPKIQNWMEAMTARQAREVGEMRAAVEAIKAELVAVQAERENDRLRVVALRHRVDELESERSVAGYLARVVAGEFRVRMRAASASAVQPTRLA